MQGILKLVDVKKEDIKKGKIILWRENIESVESFDGKYVRFHDAHCGIMFDPLYFKEIVIEFDTFAGIKSYIRHSRETIPLNSNDWHFAKDHIGEEIYFTYITQANGSVDGLIDTTLTTFKPYTKTYTEEEVFNLIIRALGNLRHYSLLSDINLIKGWWDKNK